MGTCDVAWCLCVRVRLINVSFSILRILMVALVLFSIFYFWLLVFDECQTLFISWPYWAVIRYYLLFLYAVYSPYFFLVFFSRFVWFLSFFYFSLLSFSRHFECSRMLQIDWIYFNHYSYMLNMLNGLMGRQTILKMEQQQRKREKKAPNNNSNNANWKNNRERYCRAPK